MYPGTSLAGPPLHSEEGSGVMPIRACSSGYVIQPTCYVIYHEYHYFVVVALTTRDYFHRRVRSQECNVRC